MKWEKVELYKTVSDGTDLLGNDIPKNELVRTAYARLTPWNNVDTQIDGRTITVNDRKYLVRIPFNCFPKTDKVKVGENIYNVNQITDFQKFTLLYVRLTKGERDNG